MNADSLQANLHYSISDGGPIYHETNFDNFIVEPWNGFSSLVIALPVIYFLIKLKGNYQNYKFIIYWCSPLLFLGGIGSFIYHAFRVSPVFLALDVIPIALLTLSICLYLLIKILPNWIYAAIILVLTIFLRGLIFYFWEGQTAINISYLITILVVLVPAVFYIIKIKFYKTWLLAITLFMFVIALFFRYVDDWDNNLLSMGTHWIWHLFCALGSFSVGVYLIKTTDFERYNKNQVNKSRH